MNGADVDDAECGHIAQALSHNSSITRLGLAKNLIGKAEVMNVLNPDLVTGGEAIGENTNVKTNEDDFITNI